VLSSIIYVFGAGEMGATHRGKMFMDLFTNFFYLLCDIFLMGLTKNVFLLAQINNKTYLAQRQLPKARRTYLLQN
jgi:hypothetical protein